MNGSGGPSPVDGRREAIAALQVEVQHLTAAVARLDKKMDALTAQANRWKGAFLVILALGGALGWLLDRMLKLVAQS